jgi:hypothetical protein
MKTISVVLVLLLGAASKAVSADIQAPSPSPEQPPLVIQGPTFSFTGYLWAAGLNGRSSTLPPFPATKVDISFADELKALKDLDGAFMGAGEVRFGRWGFLTDIMFSQLSPGGSLPGGASLDLRTRTVTVQEDILYRVYSDAVVNLDIGAGVRYWNLDNKLKIGPTVIVPGGLEHSVNEDWFDPVVAARAAIQITGPWSITLGATSAASMSVRD